MAGRASANRDGGNVAVIVALCFVPVVVAAGGATDFTRASTVRAKLQEVSDQTALAAAVDGPKQSLEPRKAHARAQIADAALDGEQAEAIWTSESDVRVTLTGDVPTAFLGAVPGLPDELSVTVVSVARRAEDRYTWKLPKVAQLDPEAGDYNELFAYCFDPNGRDRPDKGRSAMVAFADNGGSRYELKEEDWPQCGAGQYLSFKLRNVRNARTQPNRWKDRNAEQYEYFTDTQIIGGIEEYDLDGVPILETVFCRNLGECKPKNQNGVIPTGKNRTPEKNTKPCEKGGLMYYGWEDRPPGRGATDRDYDDIRVMIECPEKQQVSARDVWLIR